MENGKPTGPKPKWWSRPAHSESSSLSGAARTAPAAGATASDGGAVAAPVDDRPEYPLPPPAPMAPHRPADGGPQGVPTGPRGEAVPTAPPPPGGTPAEGERSQEPAPDDTPAGDPAAAAGLRGDGPARDPGPHPARDGAPATAVEPTHRPADGTGESPHRPADAPAAGYAGEAMRPLHEPDEHRTPPYGDPGPWAPAPPVQHPTGAGGTPPRYPADGSSPGPGPAPAPVPGPLPQAAPAAEQWRQYDPWGASGAPLIGTGEPPKRKSRRGTAFAGGLLFALLAGVLGGGVGAYLERNGGITTVELPQAGPENTDRAPGSVAGIAASALPGVVTLHVSGGGEQGTGTGFVLDAQGHILTNNHVVSPAGSSGDISVTFSGGETARATLVGKDSGYDLAVVKVRGVSGLKPLPLGNSDNVRVGDPVVAIGAPFDLQNTVTAGIISAKERPITAGGEKGDGSDISYVDALQTDAPINPGNSGGPLVDSKARVIGINSAIRAADGGSGPDSGSGQAGSIGLGFAIPINQGKRVAEELINTGKATHPVIGVSLDMQYSGDGARVGEKGKDGAPSVITGGPAAKAGIRPGDVITKVDGQRVHSGEELIVKIRAHRPGDRLELTVLRDGGERTRTVTLGSSTGS
ncbi:S1C family serine protease [Streptomyces sp. I6]|uniref:S1C family serine protease n=1 Tax=Streptomyces sp. I6 TaxID=2483113 RepID=UPI000F4478E3|nr:trypsin-like peptidase domain-containing protein [Streptomyces sp. I6]RNL72624.1 PDZ domain-containing protein [Streptomyces sp. I6]